MDGGTRRESARDIYSLCDFAYDHVFNANNIPFLCLDVSERDVLSDVGLTAPLGDNCFRALTVKMP